MLKSGVTLFVVRHGETDWNLARRYQGQTDIPLNATGRAQAARNGRTLAGILGAGDVRHVYVASPLMRARETMEILRAAAALEPVDAYATDPRLQEIHFGHWEGLIWDDLPRTDPIGFSARKADNWNWQPDGGESYRMLSDRVAGWLAEVDRDTLVVTHGGVSRVLRGLVLGLDPNDIPVLEVPQDKVLRLDARGQQWL
ncbi:MAG: histidine phosphatase family protein [Hyphomicrobiaceae bacterium]